MNNVCPIYILSLNTNRSIANIIEGYKEHYPYYEIYKAFKYITNNNKNSSLNEEKLDNTMKLLYSLCSKQ